MKGLSVAPAHILIPVITSGIFLMYYTFSTWDANIKIIAFYQAVGAGFPVLIGIFTAVLMEQEYMPETSRICLPCRKRRWLLSQNY